MGGNTMEQYDKVDKLVNDMLNIDLPSIPDMLDPAADVVGAAIPYVGSLWTSFKIGRLKKRLNKIEPELSEIKERIERKENEVFYKLEVFPLIIKQIYEEDEESKIPIIINGFEYTVDEAVEEMEKVYHFFDVLSELRVTDITRLFNKYVPGYHSLRPANNGPFVETQEIREQLRERKSLDTYIDNKLERVGLIYTEEEDLAEYMADPKNRYRRRRSPRTQLTSFGVRFVDFFKEE